MFTGIVREVGRVARLEPGGGGLRLGIEAELVRRLAAGDSLAVNGACLTVVAVEGSRASFEAVPETLARTTLGGLRKGHRVNLEPPLAAGDPLGGHFVQGHVDGTGEVESLVPRGDGAHLRVRVEPALARLMIPKGSIAVDGVSLTLVEVEAEAFGVALIPYTLEHTTLGERRPGERVNLEADMLGKYVVKLLQTREAGGVDRGLLERAGFLGK